MLTPADLYHFLDTTDELFALVSPDGGVLGHNAAWTRLLGRDAAEMAASELPGLATADAREVLILALVAAATEVQRRVVGLCAADGAIHACELWLSPGDAGRVRVRGRVLDERRQVHADARRVDLLARVIDTVPVVLWQVDREGKFLLSEGGALAQLGLTPGQAVGASVFDIYRDWPTVIDAVHRGLAGDQTVTHTRVGELHFANYCRPLRDEAGEVVGLTALTLDITAQAQAERRVREQADRLERQQRAMLAMGTPILQVWDGLLCVPVIGVVDADRASAITEAVLAAATQRRARAVILDLTGVDDIDAETAMHFVRIVRAVALLGARGVVVGIRPAIAQALVELGLELQLETLADLQDALRACLPAAALSASRRASDAAARRSSRSR